MAAPRSNRPIFARAFLLSFLAVVAAAFLSAPVASAAAAPDETTTTTCVPSLERLLSCLDFIEHRAEEIPVPCCVQLRRTVAEQPCCLMHVMRGNAARLIGPEYDSARAMVNVTTECLGGDAGVLVSITRNCSGKPLPPLTPEFTFTTAAPPPPPSSSGASRLQGLSSSSITALFQAVLVSLVVYGAVVVL